MKNTTKVFVLLLLFNTPLLSQVEWDVDYESANFAFLKVDYNTYSFEGGYFTKFPYYEGYDREYIPFTIIYNSPLDYGNITFLYQATDDTIFAADIWWAGTGKITFPDTIIDASQFDYDSTNAFPYWISYYDYVSEIPDSVFYSKADSAWKSIRKLSVLNSFEHEGVFRVGLYLYAPTVGEFNPEVAKWIIFLYRGQIIVGVEDEKEKLNSFKLLQNYPNPFNPSTIIEYSIPKLENVQITLFNTLGEEIKTLVNAEKPAGDYEVEFNSDGLNSGIYFYKLKAGDFVQTKKMILMK